jgi:altronate dehydratase
MNRLIDDLIGRIKNVRNMDREQLAREAKELGHHLHKQLFSQIPGVSAIVGLLAGWWVASTFTSSPLRGLLSQWGIMKGGSHVVSSTTYSIISIVLPLIAIAVTAYIVQKVLRAYREQQMERNKAYVAELGEAVRSEMSGKISILDKAREADLLSEDEYRTKVASLYRSYSRNYHSKIEEIIIKKLES